MFRTSTVFALALLAAGAHAATTTTTVTINASTGALTGATINITGTAKFSPGIPDTSGNFASSFSFSAISGTSGNADLPFTITFPSSGTLTGSISLPLSLLTGSATSGSAPAKITGGTGTYANATGNIALSGTATGGLTTGFTFALTGSGSVTTGGSTGGGGGLNPTPTITAVLDAAGNTANLAQGTIFIVKGTSLCPGGQNFFNVPRPTVAPDGVKITFTPSTGGTGTDALLWYEYNPSGTCQLAGILQSTVAPGNYNVTVTNGTASAPFAVKVMKSKFSLFTQDSSGTGLASVQNYISTSQVDLNSFTSGSGKGTTISPAHPGQFMLAYGTGLGPLVGGDNTASPAYDFNANGVNVKAIVGGMTISVAYAGRAGYAGEDQINFALPSNVPTGCAVPFQISVDGVLSNPTFIAIAPDTTSAACVMPGFTSTQLGQFDQGGSYTIGGFSLTDLSATVASQTVKVDAVGGAFTKYTGYQLAAATSTTVTSVTTGSCQVYQAIASSTQTTATASGTVLDAGAITLTGPAGSSLTNVPLNKDGSNLYSLSIGATAGILLPGAVNGTIVAGTYTLNGAGGKDIGAFTAKVSIGSPLTVTGGLPSTVNRGSGLTLNWTGGNSSDLVEITGSSTAVTSAGTTSSTFVCTTTAGAQTFTVPSSILQQLPATSTGGSLSVFTFVNPLLTSGNGSFTAPLTAGGNIDAGFFLGLSGTAGAPIYQ